MGVSEIKWSVLVGLFVSLLSTGEGGVARNSDSGLAIGPQCAPGSRWKSQCNSCTCSEDGLPQCTDMACLGHHHGPEMQCAPNTTWPNECSTCWCTENGIAFCNKVACIGSIDFGDINDDDYNDTMKLEIRRRFGKPTSSVSRKVRGVSQGPPKACQPGQEFRMDCNRCLCNNEGQHFSCTRIDCAASSANNGAVAISRTSRKKRATDSDVGFRCNPGEQFKKECKDCTCSADGRSVFCTVRLCDTDLNPAT